MQIPDRPESRRAVPERIRRHFPGWLLVGLLAAGAVLRLHRLGDGLWFDEIQTLVDYVRLPLGTILRTYDSQNQHLLYSLLARLSVSGLGESAASLRLPAAILGVASLYAVYLIGREISSQREALLATGLLTVSYHHLWFSQNARGYTGLLLGALLTTWALHKILSDPARGNRWIALYGVSMALTAYMHITATLTAAAQFGIIAFVGLRSTDRALWRRLALAFGMAAGLGLLLYAPVLTQMVGTLLVPSPHAAESEWKNPLWLVAETAAGLARGLPGGWAGLGLGLAVASAGMLSFARQSPTLLALMVFPALLTAAVVVGLGHNLWPRFFFFSAGVAVLIAVRGTFTLAAKLLPRRGPTVATGLLVLGAMVSATTLPRAWGPKQDYVGAARYIADHARPDDTVFTVDLTDYPLNQYLGHSWPRLEELPALEAAERGQGRTWVVYTFPIRLAAVEPEIWARLESTYDTAAVFRGTVGGGDLVVMVHDPPREPS